MDTFGDLIAAIQSDFSVGIDSTMYPLPAIKNALNRAYSVAGGLFLWPATEDSVKTSAKATYEYYDYPQGWFPESAYKLTVDGKDYGDPLVFKDYLYEQENNHPSGLKYAWANQNTRYFIDPTPTVTGNKNISIWGQKAVDWLVEDADTTIFSFALRQCNHAVVLEAEKLLRIKGGDSHETMIPRVGDMRDLEAKDILSRAWMRIKQNKSKFEKTQPMLDVPDMFTGRKRSARFTKGEF